MSSPPARLLADPIDETVTSSAAPARANAGSSAVTTTAAAFLALSSAASTVTPSRVRSLASERRTTGELASSPVPARPTTMPKPVRWLARTPAMLARSLTRSARAGVAAAPTSTKPMSENSRTRRGRMGELQG
jgi:hypothetical protein